MKAAENLKLKVSWKYALLVIGAILAPFAVGIVFLNIASRVPDGGVRDVLFGFWGLLFVIVISALWTFSVLNRRLPKLNGGLDPDDDKSNREDPLDD